MTDKKLTVENFKKAEEKERRLLEDYGYKALSIERLRHREMMTNKEQIIINGINIFDTLDEWADLISQNWCSAEYQTAEIIKNHILGINKQLARKTQECEELKEKLKTAENDAIVRFVEKNIQCVSPTNCRFVNLCKQECEKKQNIIEELEKKLKEISANYIV